MEKAEWRLSEEKNRILRPRKESEARPSCVREIVGFIQNSNAMLVHPTHDQFANSKMGKEVAEATKNMEKHPNAEG